MLPVRAALVTAAPFTYIRRVAPSYVTARWVQTPDESCPTPYTVAPAPANVPPPPGFLLLREEVSRL